MATYVPAKKNTAFITYVGLPSRSNALTLQANPTLAAGDVKVAIDDGAPANLATLPVVDADFTKRVKVSLNSAEMNGDNISIIFSDAAGDEWCDLIVNIQTTANQIDDIPTLIAALNDITAEDVWDSTSATLTVSFETLMDRVYQFLMNKMLITDADGSVALRNVADDADMATQSITDDDTTTTRTALTWS